MRTLFICWGLISLAVAPGIFAFEFDRARNWGGFDIGGKNCTIELRDATIQTTASDDGSRTPALAVVYNVAKNPALILRLRDPGEWSGSTALAVQVTNADPFEVLLYVRIEESSTAGKPSITKDGQVVIPPKTSTTLILPFALPPAMTFGMRDAARLPGAVIAQLSGPRPLDLAQIGVVQFYLAHPSQPHRLTFAQAQLIQKDLTPLLYSAICDTYGQFTKESWPGKMTRDEDLKNAAKADDSLLLSAAPEPDGFGGLPGPPVQPPSGFFTTRRDADGNWWLITPTGHLFYSIGVDSLQQKWRGTYTQNREWMFTDLPGADSPLAAHYGTADNRANTPGRQVRGYDHGRHFNFYAANLQRKYGPDFVTRWQRTTLDRMRAWGFNTIGNSSDEALLLSTDSRGHRMPYVCSLWYGGESARVETPHDWWGPLVDPFDPRFAENVEKNLRPSLLAHRADPYLVGYFVDNELSWANGRDSAKDREHFSLLYGVLQQGADSPAKHAWVRQLEAKYGSATELNQSWRTNFASWDEFLRTPYPVPDTLPSATMRSDFSAFLKGYASQYFRVISDVIRRHDPQHLNLGCRFSNFASETVEAGADYCDVVSFNIYAPEVSGPDWSVLDRIAKPALVGEFHFGATDRGGFGPGLIPVENQAERANSYRQYLRSVLKNPHFVGAHWFAYVDEPLTGRMNDGENYAFGLVMVTDQPYPELTKAAMEINRDAYAIRSSGRALSSPTGKPDAGQQH